VIRKTIFEKLIPIEKTIYHKMKDPLLFYDISELGWSRYISAHINYLFKNGKKVFVCCNKSREFLYRGIAEILPMPDLYYKEFGDLLSASHHLHDPIKNIDIVDTEIISKPFRDEYPDYTIITEYSKFNNQRIFEPYKHSEKSEKFTEKFRKCIIVFPRFRPARFGRRNISEDKWIKIIEKLCFDFPEYDILSIGGIQGTLNIDLPHQNYFNLVLEDDNLDLMVSLINTNKVITSIGTQSGIMHIATLCKSPSFIVGHDPYDMGIFTENFTNADIKFFQTIETENGYKINNIDKLINEIINFVNLIKKYRNV
jgi:ADP-heptose:LPS heptosyltransferase